MAGASVSESSQAKPDYTPLQQLRCHDCDKTTSGYSDIGFCSRCGAPLCPKCALRKVTQSDYDMKTIIVPLLVVHFSISWTVSVRAETTVCKDCLKKRQALDNRTSNFLLLGLVVIALLFGAVFTIFSYPLIGMIFLYSFVISLLILVIGAPIFLVLTRAQEAKYGPFCPVCGLYLIPYFLRVVGYSTPFGSHHSTTTTLPNHLLCPSCGYTGPISPFEGMWRYVAANGPTRLNDTPLYRMALLSCSYNLTKGAGKR